jgi:hypothetical protein
MDRAFLTGFVDELVKIARRLDARLGDGPSVDHTGRAGVNYRGSGGPPRPEQADILFVGNIQPADIVVSSDRRSS